MFKMLFLDREYSILEKYRKLRLMEEGDKSMLEKLATLGFIKYGLSFDNYGSAGLTRVGIERLNREKNLRNPIKRTLSNIINYVL